MPRRTNKFQRLIVLIENALAQPDATVTESKELADKITNDKREVDIVIESSDGIRSLIVSIECTGGDHSRPATVEWVERMWGKHTSLPTNKLVLVSQAGFSPAARKKANWLGIDTYSLEEAEKLDWVSAIRNIQSIRIVSFIKPYANSITLVFAAEPNIEELDLSTLNLPQLVLYDLDGKSISTASEVVNKWLSDPALLDKAQELAFTDAGTTIDFERRLRDGVHTIDGKGIKRRVVAIRVEAKCRKEETQITLDQHSYGQIAVASGTGSTLGRQAQVVIVQQPSSDINVGFRIERKQSI